MTRSSKCSGCGSEDLVSGRVRGNVGFVPDGAPVFGSVEAATPIDAVLCMKCGELRLRGDVRWVAKVLGRFVPGHP
jgi:hypothetical protein